MCRYVTILATLCPKISTSVTAPKLNTFSVDSTTATSITVRWSVSSDSLVDRFVVMWEKSVQQV